MGFYIEVNSILRSDADFKLEKGAVNGFEKSGSRVFFDDIPIWLTRSDWTARAEILVRSQTRTPGGVAGTFEVTHVYGEAEQGPITEMFRRMYASGGDSYIYLLRSEADFRAALASGTLYDESLKTSGFIHASPVDQLTRVANKFYRGVGAVVCCVVRTLAVDAPVKWEPATGGLYPHIYGPLNMDAVAWTVPVMPGADDCFDITPASLDRKRALNPG